MATTAKIAKEAKTPKFKVRQRNRCRRAAGRAPICASSRCAVSASASWRSRRGRGRDEEQLVRIDVVVGDRSIGNYEPDAIARHDHPRSRTCRNARSSAESDMTDPIADMLTRIRNAVTAGTARGHAGVALQGGDRADPRERRLHPGLQGWTSRRTSASQAQLRLILKYGPRGETRDHRARTGQPSRPARLLRTRRRAERARRSRHQHPDHVARRDDRPRGGQGRRRRRSAL